MTIMAERPSSVQRVSLEVISKQERDDIGGFSETKKMPWLSYSLSAKRCQTGGRLHAVDGSTCSKCYALRGNYMWPRATLAMEKRYSHLVSNPVLWVKSISRLLKRRAKLSSVEEPFLPFRWHDSGDLQGVWHLDAIAQIARSTLLVNTKTGRKPIRHWLPTREYGYVRDWIKEGNKIPSNLIIRLSAHMIDGPAPKKLAHELGCHVSTVHTKEESCPEAWICPSESQQGKCEDCRKCWSSKVFSVSYHKH